MTMGALAIDEVERIQSRLSHLEQERKHLLAVIEILQEIGGTLHFNDIVQSVARRLGEAFGLDRCSIFLAERGEKSVRLVATYEDPGIRNYVVDLDRYPELRRALQTGETVFIADAATDPTLGPARWALAARKVKTITVVPISWRGTAIGAMFLRSFRDGPSFTASDLQFCQVVANLTAKALRNAHRFERMRERRDAGRSMPPHAKREAVLLEFIRRLLAAYPAADTEDAGGEAGGEGGSGNTEEIDRLVEVAQAVLSQESAAR